MLAPRFPLAQSGVRFGRPCLAGRRKSFHSVSRPLTASKFAATVITVTGKTFYDIAHAPAIIQTGDARRKICDVGNSSCDGVAGHSVNRGKVTEFLSRKTAGIWYDSFMNTKTGSTNYIHGLFGRSALLSLLLGCFALCPMARAVVPAPDGGYPNDNTAEGHQALLSLTLGSDNTAVGDIALQADTIGFRNTAIGSKTLKSNIDGSENTALGFAALRSNTHGDYNTAVGSRVLPDNTIGDNNTAVGFAALFSNTPGSLNTATGAGALVNNTIASSNTANGFFALGTNTGGSSNTALGFEALPFNTSGSQNTATGAVALFNNSTGQSNTADGQNTLHANVTGSDSAAFGAFALDSNTDGDTNTAVGFGALLNSSRASNNIALGAAAGSNLTFGGNNIDVGNTGVAGENKTIRIGTTGTQTATFIAGISGATVSGGAAVFVDADGHLGTMTSSARFKREIKPMDKASEAILQLEPVTFRYKKELDPDGVCQFGLIAEQVEKVDPSLIVRDEEGKVETVRYEAVNAMLLNEFLKEHRKNEEQQATIAQLKSGMDVLTATVKEQAAQIQKVSAQLELSKPVPQTVLNGR